MLSILMNNKTAKSLISLTWKKPWPTGITRSHPHA